MQTREISLILMFCLNSWAYLHFDQKMSVAQALQCLVALISMAFISYYGIDTSSIPYALCVLVTGTLITLSFYYEVGAYLMLTPLIFLFSIPKIIQKLYLIL